MKNYIKSLLNKTIKLVSETNEIIDEINIRSENIHINATKQNRPLTFKEFETLLDLNDQLEMLFRVYNNLGNIRKVLFEYLRCKENRKNEEKKRNQ